MRALRRGGGRGLGNIIGPLPALLCCSLVADCSVAANAHPLTQELFNALAEAVPRAGEPA